MRSRSVTRATDLTWLSLPAEIRFMILTTIAYQKYPGWASFASVCKEWQYVLEKVNFYKIKLRVSCLDAFKRIASPQKRRLIHHICLEVGLPRYTSTCCSKRRSPPVKISTIVSDGIWKLFSILGTWERAGNLALELNVYSPSDCKHWFRNFYLSSDNVDDDKNVTPDAWEAKVPIHDPQHGWMNGQQVKAPPRSSLLRLFRRIWLDFSEPLPRIKAVNSFIIRRQLRRRISLAGLGMLLNSFDRLEKISYEPWFPYEDSSREFHDRALASTMREKLPDTLDRLVIFEDSYKFYDPFPKLPAPVWWYNLVDPSEGLGAVFASKSRNLEHIAIAFMINAEEIFQQCQPTWTWSRLQSLALTSQLLQEDWEKRREIETLLCRASTFVRRMPKMHTFVLWNGGKAHACAFIYRIDRDCASVTWRGTWRLELSPLVVKAWQIAAPKQEFFGFEVRQESIQEEVKSHGDAIYHLELPCEVVEPASLWQIRREGCS